MREIFQFIVCFFLVCCAAFCAQHAPAEIKSDEGRYFLGLGFAGGDSRLLVGDKLEHRVATTGASEVRVGYRFPTMVSLDAAYTFLSVMVPQAQDERVRVKAEEGELFTVRVGYSLARFRGYAGFAVGNIREKRVIDQSGGDLPRQTSVHNLTAGPVVGIAFNFYRGSSMEIDFTGDGSFLALNPRTGGDLGFTMQRDTQSVRMISQTYGIRFLLLESTNSKHEAMQTARGGTYVWCGDCWNGFAQLLSHSPRLGAEIAGALARAAIH